MNLRESFAAPLCHATICSLPSASVASSFDTQLDMVARSGGRMLQTRIASLTPSNAGGVGTIKNMIGGPVTTTEDTKLVLVFVAGLPGHPPGIWFQLLLVERC